MTANSPGLFGYYIVLEGLSGRTLEKRVAGVVVVSRDESPITFRQAFARTPSDSSTGYSTMPSASS